VLRLLAKCPGPALRLCSPGSCSPMFVVQLDQWSIAASTNARRKISQKGRENFPEGTESLFNNRKWFEACTEATEASFNYTLPLYASSARRFCLQTSATKSQSGPLKNDGAMRKKSHTTHHAHQFFHLSLHLNRSTRRHSSDPLYFQIHVLWLIRFQLQKWTGLKTCQYAR